MLKTLVPLAAALLAAPIIATPLREAPIVERNGDSSVSIGLTGLDLATPSGRAALRQKVDLAIRRLCDAPLPIDYTLNRHRRTLKGCRTLTSKATEPQLQRLFERRGEVKVSTLIIASRFAAR